jgi:hypothetical protein
MKKTQRFRQCLNTSLSTGQAEARQDKPRQVKTRGSLGIHDIGDTTGKY